MKVTVTADLRLSREKGPSARQWVVLHSKFLPYAKLECLPGLIVKCTDLLLRPVSMRGLRVDKGSSSRRVTSLAYSRSFVLIVRPRKDSSTRGLGRMMISRQHAFSRRKVNSRNRCWGKNRGIIPCLQNMFHLRVKPRTGRRHSETRYQG